MKRASFPRASRASLLFITPVLIATIAPVRASAAIELNGLWRVGLFARAFEDVCAVIIEHDGTALAIRGSCQGVANPLNVTGTLDPETGKVTLSGTVGVCSAVTMEGTANSARIAARFACPPHADTVGVMVSRCGNGQLDAGEACDDGNVIDGDCCSSGCALYGAGTPCTDDGNPCTVDTCNATGQCQHISRTGLCNDGNSCTIGDSCIDGECVVSEQPDGFDCDDGNPCTVGDTCRGGVCIASAMECPPCQTCNVGLGCVPAITNACKQAPAHSLMLQHRSTDTVQWKWLRGETTQPAELGSPTTSSDYDFCIYDASFDANGAPRLVFGARAEAGSDWHPTKTGFAYDNQTLTPSAARRMLLRAGAQGRSAVLAKGEAVTLPPLQSLAFPVTVQVKTAGQGACWSAAYGRAAVERPEAMRATLARRGAETRPNIIVVNLDDTRADGVDRMPTLLSRIAGQGATFTNSFVVTPLCAPSRASLLTGLVPRHHGVRALGGVIGGARPFREMHSDQQTIAAWLQQAGYMTGLFGKYINGYSRAEETAGPGGMYYVPPGWTRWRGMTSPEHYGGFLGGTYTLVDEHGVATVYDDHRSDRQYSTDVLGAELRTFIADAIAAGRPFFALWTPYASHVDVPSLRPEPAHRHLRFFFDLPAWQPASWGEPDVSDKPRHIQDLEPAGFGNVILGAGARNGAYETLLSVDENLSLILDDLARFGIDDNTVIIVTSDNGVEWGEHRGFVAPKQYPYEECLRVPMFVRDPRMGGAAVVRDAAVLSIDVAPTVAALAGVVPPVSTDGASFASWLGASPPAQWRNDFLIEHYRSTRDDSLEYTDQMADGDRVRLLYGNARIQPRASALFEFDDGSGVSEGAVAVPIGSDADVTFANLGEAVTATVPFTAIAHAVNRNLLTVLDTSAELYGVYWIVERDQRQVIDHRYLISDYFGVRDVSNGFTYVEHESGERELYDLHADPSQLTNKAGDPAYMAAQDRLANRLVELLR